MAKTNWQDPKTGEIISPQISGLQEAVGKIEESIGINSVSEEGIPLEEVFISNDDRYRIFQAPIGKRNWVAEPKPVIKKNGLVITTGFEIDYGGGAIVLNINDTVANTYTVNATFTVNISDVRKDLTEYKEDYVSNFKIGKNIFDKSKVTFSFVLSITTGLPVAEGSGWGISDFCIVEPSTNYIGKDISDVVCFYDMNRVFISGVSTKSFSTPANARYLRIKIHRSAVDTAQIEKGTVSTSYEPFKYEMPRLDITDKVSTLTGMRGSVITPKYRNGKLYRLEEKVDGILISYTELVYTRGVLSGFRTMRNNRVVNAVINKDLSIIKTIEE